MGAGGPTPKAGPAAPGVAGAYRQRCVEIDDCLIQNPAYSLARTRRGPGESQGLFWSLLIPVLLLGVLVDAAEEQLPAPKGQVLPARLRVEGDDPPHRVHPQLPEGGLYWSPWAAPPHCSQMHVRFSRISSGTVSGQETSCGFNSPSGIS